MSRDRRIKIGLRRQYLNQVPSTMIPPYMYYQQPQFTQAPPNFNNTNMILVPDFAPFQIPTTQTTSYSSYAAEVPTLTSTQRRASSGAWKLQDDNQLVAARMEGLSWNHIKETYFPHKSANACRKRHERVVQRQSAGDQDTRKIQLLAREYVRMRKEMWRGLAARTGEKWNVVEAKCAANGLKNIRSAARAASRHNRSETNN
ncbi:hypothetical protein E4U17_005438 [Claviceps sp. LM77 group G4]|nr:hypothetical protein E4U17_005438 [Claviceps sp. LM77 group G4]KAG6072045.1 hypothetical protein E4U33_003382 [Claviceps sp. LM78 group G4]